MTTVVHHKGCVDGSAHAPNTLPAIRESAESGAAWVEIDVHALEQDDYLVLHDDDLSHETTGTGRCIDISPAEARSLRLRTHPDEHPPLLSDVVALLGDYPNTYLQIDFKDFMLPPDVERMTRLEKIVAPMQDRVIVSSPADWALRALHRVAPHIRLGFDPLFYLDWRDPSREYPPHMPPSQRGAYDYHDDALTSRMRLMPPADYLRDRCDMLMGHVSAAMTFFINYRLLVQSLDDGFNWAATLQQRGRSVFAWTVDAGSDDHDAIAKRLQSAGVAGFTTNTPFALAEVLEQ